LIRVYPADGSPFVYQLFLYHIYSNLYGGVCGSLSISRLEHKQRSLLYGKFYIL
jgi:hypothetical protein